MLEAGRQLRGAKFVLGFHEIGAHRTAGEGECREHDHGLQAALKSFEKSRHGQFPTRLQRSCASMRLGSIDPG
jgi:hypothetical protein